MARCSSLSRVSALLSETRRIVSLSLRMAVVAEPWTMTLVDPDLGPLVDFCLLCNRTRLPTLAILDRPHTLLLEGARESWLFDLDRMYLIDTSL